MNDYVSSVCGFRGNRKPPKRPGVTETERNLTVSNDVVYLANNESLSAALMQQDKTNVERIISGMNVYYVTFGYYVKLIQTSNEH